MKAFSLIASHFIVLIFFLISRAEGQALFNNETVQPRMRVIVDNDFSGDPDGLFQLAHLLLSPSVEVRGIIGSHLRVGDGFDNSSIQAENAVRKAKELLNVMGIGKKIPVLPGSNIALTSETTPFKNAAVDLIVAEALRTDTTLPLYVLCGAGLTEIASALLTDSRISEKLTLIWIGGNEYTDLAFPPPNYSSPEYNLNIDIKAARVVFNSSKVKLWQVPRDAYRQTLLPYSQLLLNVKPHGATGAYLAITLEELMKRIQKYVNVGETYILGDSPLVLLTALQSSFEADPSSSHYAIKIAPNISEEGAYQFNPSGRNIRVYTKLDVQLMFNDFFAKLQLFAKP